MGITPDRRHGPLIEEDYILLGTGSGKDSNSNGVIKYISGTGFIFKEMGYDKILGPINNTDASGVPSLFDGSNKGYSVGSVWILSASQQAYMLVDETSGSSVWKNTTGINDIDHKSLRQLVHFIDDGPGDNLYDNPYKEIVGGMFPTRITWWTNSNKNYKIFQTEITRSGIYPTTQSYKVYSSTGIQTNCATDVIIYDGPFEVARKRSFT